MPDSFSRGDVRLGHGPQDESVLKRPASDTPFRIAIFGDFSGRSSRGAERAGEKLEGRRAILVDRDNFHQVLDRLAPEVHVAIGRDGDSRVVLRIREFDDFEPDTIYRDLPLFQAMRALRKKLRNPETFEQAAKEMGADLSDARQEAPPPAAPEPRDEPAPADDAEGGGLLDQILGATLAEDRPAETRAEPKGRPADAELDEVIRRIVSPHLVPNAHPQQADLVAQLDASIGEQMRALLHDPGFQTVEAAWRALFRLIRNLETGADLKIHIVDVTHQELRDDLGSQGDLRQTGAYRLLMEETVGTPGQTAFAVAAGLYTIAPDARDLLLLHRLSKILAVAGTPLLLGSSTEWAGCPAIDQHPDPDRWLIDLDPKIQQAWNTLRSQKESAYLGLVAPRFLLRLPYGANGSSVESFEFEEMDEPPRHQHYLWCNPAIAAIELLAEAFNRSGWEMRPGEIRELSGIPVHTFEQGGEKVMKPCAEVWLTQKGAEKLLAQGIMPLASIKDRDATLLVRFQSVADPATALAGTWN